LAITTPLFQTSRLPDLTQVNFFPASVEFLPAFGHLAPALIAALIGAVLEIVRNRDTQITINFFMLKRK
jgi:hypothetical protein